MMCFTFIARLICACFRTSAVAALDKAWTSIKGAIEAGWPSRQALHNSPNSTDVRRTKMYVYSSGRRTRMKAVHLMAASAALVILLLMYAFLGAEHPLVCVLGRMETTLGSRKLAVSSEEQYHVIVGRL